MITTKWIENDDIIDAHLIRRIVFIEEQNVSEEGEMDDSDDGAIHLVVYDNKIPVATGRIIFVEGKCYLGRVAVLKESRKNGFGDLVMRMLIRRAFEMGYEKQYIHAQTYALEFYNKLGFVKYGEDFLEENIPHIHMVHEGDISGNCC